MGKQKRMRDACASRAPTTRLGIAARSGMMASRPADTQELLHKLLCSGHLHSPLIRLIRAIIKLPSPHPLEWQRH